MPNDSLVPRLSGKLYGLFVTLMVIYATVSSFAPMMNQDDLGWQVAQGRWMVRHGAFYSHDTFNYPNLGHALVNEYPLFEVALYVAWSLGWWGPSLLAALAYVTLLIILFRAAREFETGDSAAMALAVGLMFLFFFVAFPLRPHLATYLGVIALGVFLLRHREPKGWTEFWPMALLQIVWTNSHSGFVLGPAMVGLFGAEMTLRRWWRDRSFPWPVARTWFGVFALILLACFVNPYGYARFYPPFFQDRLESIRAYVGEMEPLTGGLATIYGGLTMAALGVVVLAAARRGGAIGFSFLLPAIVLFAQAQEVQKAWPVFGLFVPLLVLSSAALTSPARRVGSWLGPFALFVTTVLAAMAVMAQVDNRWSGESLQGRWREYDRGHSEMPTAAVAWMREHQITGRLFHRCEDGGWLQMSGYDQGETFANTGFGQYDEAFIHEVGLVNERPALMPRFVAAYQPDFIVCGTFCYQWPHYLRMLAWRPVFYSPNSTVWARPGIRLDLPTVSPDEIAKAFDRDLGENGMPVDIRLFGRNIIALNSLGLEDFAFAKLTELPAAMHHAPWYWEAARFLCFAAPAFSAAHRDALVQEAETLHDDAVTAEFRAYARYFGGNDADGALGILRAIPPDRLGNYAAQLLLKIELDRNDPGALVVARRTDSFDLRNGTHWQYLAEAEERWGSIEAARAAWRKAVFYYPDDAAVMAGARDFAARQHDPDLARAIAASGDVYGVARP